jgi:hypothetical protein
MASMKKVTVAATAEGCSGDAASGDEGGHVARSARSVLPA